MKTATATKIDLKTASEIATERAARIRVLSARREEAEAEIARELRAAMEGEFVGDRAEFLKWTNKEFGWGRTATYNHLNPELLQKQRARDRSRSVNAGSGPAATRPARSEPACELPSAERDLAAGIMHLASILGEGGFTAQALRDLKIGSGKWKAREEVKKLVVALTKLQKELEKK